MADAMQPKAPKIATAPEWRRHLSDPEEGPSGNPPPAKRPKSKKVAPSSSRASSKEEQRRHKAIEKAFLKAQSQAAAEALEPLPRPQPQAAISPGSSTAQPARDLSPDPSILGTPQEGGADNLFQTLPSPQLSEVASRGPEVTEPPPPRKPLLNQILYQRP